MNSLSLSDLHPDTGAADAIRAAAERLQPRIAFCGQIHRARGACRRIGTPVAGLAPAPSLAEVP